MRVKDRPKQFKIECYCESPEFRKSGRFDAMIRQSSEPQVVKGTLVAEKVGPSCSLSLIKTTERRYVGVVCYRDTTLELDYHRTTRSAAHVERAIQLVEEMKTLEEVHRWLCGFFFHDYSSPGASPVDVFHNWEHVGEQIVRFCAYVNLGVSINVRVELSVLAGRMLKAIGDSRMDVGRIHNLYCHKCHYVCHVAEDHLKRGLPTCPCGAELHYSAEESRLNVEEGEE